jgi:hypothetical protein
VQTCNQWFLISLSYFIGHSYWHLSKSMTIKNNFDPVSTVVLYNNIVQFDLTMKLVMLIIKRYSNLITRLERPRRFQEVKAPRSQDNRQIKVVRLSALRTGRLYPRKYSWHSCLLEAAPTPGSYCSRKNYFNEKFQ